VALISLQNPSTVSWRRYRKPDLAFLHTLGQKRSVIQINKSAPVFLTALDERCTFDLEMYRIGVGNKSGHF
jgi:hypothetical protein